MNDKRALFFAVAGVVCLLLTPVSPDEFRPVTFGVAVIYGLLAVASWLDHRSRH
ncbi:MAG: hypothetical protein ABWZ76_03480 [Acidimicrobiales bacterium]